MRNIEDIKQLLISKLSNKESGAWSRLQNSLIGKELIAFGSEVIQAADNVADSIVQAFDYHNADERSLISLSHTFDIPVSFTKPSYIRIRLSSKSVLHFKPYDLQLVIGNTKFTNIGFYSSLEDIVLYQGVVKSMYTDKISDWCFEKNVNWDTTTLSLEDDNIVVGHNLGKAFPESVYFFYKDLNSQGNLSLFNPLRYGSTIPSYKLYTLMNKDIMAIPGDGVWGKNDYNEPSFQIIWLELTNNDFSTTGILKSELHGNLQYNVLGSSKGEDNSIEYARDLYRRFYLTTNAVVSRDQIRDYVNSFSYITDCSVSVDNNHVTVYVKPEDQNDIGGYGNIESSLDLKGCLLTSHEVIKGKALNFQFSVDSPVKSELRTQIEEYLRVKYNYHSIGFSEMINTSEVSSSIYSKFGETVKVNFNVSGVDVISGVKLQFIPIQGTISIIDSLGKSVGYDLNGQIFIENKVEDERVLGKFLKESRFGDYSIQQSVIGFNDGYIKEFPLSFLKTLVGVEDVTTLKSITHNGFVYLYSNDITGSKLYVFSVSSISPQGFISNIIPVTGMSPKFMCSLEERKAIPLYKDGQLFCLYNNVTDLQLQFYTGNSTVSYYTLSIPLSLNDEILGIYHNESNLFIILPRNRCVIIQHFDTAAVSWTIKDLEIPSELGSGYLIKAFHSLDFGYCAIMFDNGSNQVIAKCRELMLVDGKVRLMNYYSIDTLKVRVQNPCIYSTTNSVWVLQAQDNYYESKLVITDYGVSYSQDDKESQYPVYNLDSTSTAGTINYNTGTITYHSDMYGTSLSYKSNIVVLDEKSFLKLNETNPVVWN